MPVTQRQISLETLESANAFGGTDQIEAEKSLPTLQFRCRMSATINVNTGGNTPVTFVDGLERLVPRIRLSAGSFKIIEDVDLRHLFEFHRRMVVDVGEVNRFTDTNANNAGDHDLELNFALHMARPHLVRAIDTALPKLPIGNRKLTLTFEWDGSSPNAASDDGTGALVRTPNGETFTWTTEPSVDVVQVVSPTLFSATQATAPKPFGIPVYATERSQGRSAAVTNRRIEFQNDRRADYLQIRQESGADDRVEDTLTEVSMRAAGQDILDQVPFEMLRSEEIETFPGVDAHQTGYIARRLAEGGRLSNHLDPAEFSGLHLLVNQDAPSIGANGQLDKMISQLVGFPGGVTQLQPRG